MNIQPQKKEVGPVRTSCYLVGSDCHPINCSMPGFPVLHYLLESAQNSGLLSWWYSLTITSSVAPFSSYLQSFPASGSFPMSELTILGCQSIGASASSTVLPMNVQGCFLYDWQVWPSCSPRDSQESSSAPQFKSINSSVLSLLYGPTLTSVHDYWKNQSFGYTDLFLAEWLLYFFIHCLGLS